jgi:hypothetical protein
MEFKALILMDFAFGNNSACESLNALLKHNQQTFIHFLAQPSDGSPALLFDAAKPHLIRSCP